jgi:hypothetical protein
VRSEDLPPVRHFVEALVEGDLRLDDGADAVVRAEVRVEVGVVARPFQHAVACLQPEVEKSDGGIFSLHTDLGYRLENMFDYLCFKLDTQAEYEQWSSLKLLLKVNQSARILLQLIMMETNKVYIASADLSVFARRTTISYI